MPQLGIREKGTPVFLCRSKGVTFHIEFYL